MNDYYNTTTQDGLRLFKAQHVISINYNAFPLYQCKENTKKFLDNPHLKAFTNAIKESPSLFSEGYFIGPEECFGKNSIVGKLPNSNSRLANSFCSPSALNFPTFTPDPSNFCANSTYDSSIACCNSPYQKSH